MNRTNDAQGRNTNLASMEEVRALRAERDALKKQLRQAPVATVAKADGPAVEYKADPRLRPALLQLVVAVENFIGPEKDKAAVRVPAELAKALAAAGELIRPQVAKTVEVKS